MTFAGFPESGLIFFEGLEADNSKTYWTTHRQTYDEDVRAPMQALLVDLESEFGTAKLYRPYRDVRFSRDKTPYKTAVAASVGEYYVQLSADGIMVAGGVYHPARDQLERLRRAVADDVQGPALERLVAGLRGQGWTIGGDLLKTSPRGYPPDHPRIELLRHRSMVASRQWEPQPWLHTARARARVRDGWRQLAGFTAWIEANVGASSEVGEG